MTTTNTAALFTVAQVNGNTLVLGANNQVTKQTANGTYALCLTENGQPVWQSTNGTLHPANDVECDVLDGWDVVFTPFANATVTELMDGEDELELFKGMDSDFDGVELPF